MTEAFRTFEVSDPAYETEGLRFATVKSRALGRRADVSLWIPQATTVNTLLILLHGVYGSHWVWPMKAGAHRLAQQMTERGEIAPMVIAMPSDSLARDGTGYLTWPGGEDVERWIVEEVPLLARLVSPQLRLGASIAIAGLSMGGYGALRLGAKYAERFCAISAHSAITEVTGMRSFLEEPLADYLTCAPEQELSALHWMRAHRDRLPPVRFDCGLSDELLEPNRRLHRALQANAIAHEYDEHPGGHAWSYWSQQLRQTLLFVDEHCRLPPRLV